MADPQSMSWILGFKKNNFTDNLRFLASRIWIEAKGFILTDHLKAESGQETFVFILQHSFFVLIWWLQVAFIHIQYSVPKYLLNINFLVIVIITRGIKT